MSNFDEKIRLGAALAHIREDRECVTKLKEKNPCHIIHNHNILYKLEPLVYPDKETWSAINAACTNILDIYIAAIDRKFAQLKAEFEALDKE